MVFESGFKPRNVLVMLWIYFRQQCAISPAADTARGRPWEGSYVKLLACRSDSLADIALLQLAAIADSKMET